MIQPRVDARQTGLEVRGEKGLRAVARRCSEAATTRVLRQVQEQLALAGVPR